MTALGPTPLRCGTWPRAGAAQSVPLTARHDGAQARVTTLPGRAGQAPGRTLQGMADEEQELPEFEPERWWIEGVDRDGRAYRSKRT